MKLKAIVCSIAIAAAGLNIASAAPPASAAPAASSEPSGTTASTRKPWPGRYQFEEFVEPNQGMQYRLTISGTSDSDLKAKLDVDGFQTLIRASCAAIVKGDSCELHYLGEHPDPDDTRLNPKSVYKKNELLLTLTRHNNRIITTFNAMQPMEYRHKRPGYYFSSDTKAPRKIDGQVFKDGFLPTDLRPSTRNILKPSHGDALDLKGNFTAFPDGTSLIVHVPGAFVDNIQNAKPALGEQVAAEVFFKLMDSDAVSPAEAITRHFMKKEVVQRAGSDVTVYSFHAKSGKACRIFTYFNDLYGLTSVVEMGPAPKKGAK